MEFWPVGHRKWRWVLLPFIGEPIATGIANSKKAAREQARQARDRYKKTGK
jgi:hypothetical protein